MEHKKFDLTGLEGKNREFAEAYNAMVDDLQKKDTTIEALQKKMQELTGLQEKLEGMQEVETKMQQMKDAIKTLEQKQGQPQGAPVDAFEREIKSMFESADYKGLKKKSGAVEIEIKEAALMTTTNVMTNAPALGRWIVDRTIHEAPRERTAIYDRVVKGSVSAPNVAWVNRVNKEGGSAFIAEGTLKPLMDWEYKQETANPKKIAVRTKVSTEMLEDFDFILSEIRRMMTLDLREVIDEKLLTGAGNADEPKGITTAAGGYTSSALDDSVVMPNEADAIRAAMLQMRTLNFYPDVVFLNPAQKAMMDLTKTSQGNYIKVELDSVLASLQIIETTRIEEGHFLLIDSSKWQVRPYNTITFRTGWENDDFSKNLVTFICEQRLFDYWNSIDLGAFIYEDFDTVKAAIEKPAAATDVNVKEMPAGA